MAQVIQYYLGEAPMDTEDNDSETSDESEDDNDGAKILLSEMVDINDRLYRFATQVRNPKARLYSAKAENFRVIDPESGVDLIQVFQRMDEDHVRQVFLGLRSQSIGSSQELSSAPPAPITPQLTVEDNILILRLAKANTYR